MQDCVVMGNLAFYKQLNLAEMMTLVIHRGENIVRKGENAGYHHFLLFLQCFQKASSSGSLKVKIMWQRLKRNR